MFCKLIWERGDDLHYARCEVSALGAVVGGRYTARVGALVESRVDAAAARQDPLEVFLLASRLLLHQLNQRERDKE